MTAQGPLLGKAKSLSLLSSSENYIYGFSQVGTFRTVTKDSTRISEELICEVCGKKTYTKLSINKVSYNIYCQKNGRISSGMLPLCLNVLKKFFIRVYYQILI